VLETHPGTARAIGRAHVRRYLPLPHYVANLRRLGFTQADMAGQGSDQLVDAIVAWGDPAGIAERIAAHTKAGADHVCIQVLGAEQRRFAIEDLRTLAPSVTTLS
jgi:probable F420-dependent oxidoreductase